MFEDPSFSAPQTSDLCEAEDEQQNGVNDRVGEASNVVDAPEDPDLNATSTSSTDLKNEFAEQVVEDMRELKVNENVSTEDANVEEQQNLSSEDVDALLDKCLLQALHTTVKDKDLPIPGSTLW